MKTEDKKKAAASAFMKDSSLSWQNMAQKHINESEELSKQVEDLKRDISQLEKEGIIEVSTSDCSNWSYSDRSDFELGDLEDLADDIKKNGQLQPAIIRKHADKEDKYEVIAGERRWRACKLAGIPLKAVVTDADDSRCIVIQTSENKNEALCPYSLSKAYLKMMDGKNISQNKMAEILSIPKSSFSNLLSFNRVPKEIWLDVGDMSKVSAKTASYMASECEKDPTVIKSFRAIAQDIREGRSLRYLEKKIQKSLVNKLQNRNKTYVSKNSEGKVLFRITDAGRVTFTEEVTSKLSVEEIQNKILAALTN